MLEKNLLVKDLESQDFGVIKRINAMSVTCTKLSGVEIRIRRDDVIYELPLVYSFKDIIEEVTVKVLFKEPERCWSVQLLSGTIKEASMKSVDFTAEYYPEDLVHDLFDKIVNKIKEMHIELHLKQKGAQLVEMKEWGTSEAFEVIEIDTNKSIEEQYHDIMNNISSTTKNVAETADLSSLKDLDALFASAKRNLEQHAKVRSRDTSGFWNKFIGAEQDKQVELTSIADNANHLFGIINSKFDTLVETGEKLQKIKLEMQSQMDALEQVLEASNAHIEELEKSNQMIPIRVISTNSQIKGSYEAYKAKLLKIESGITLTTGAVISLGSRLPAMRAGIFDEAAFSSLLSNVTGTHEMVKTTSDLMISIADMSSEQIYNKVENMLTHEVNDNSMITYLENREQHTNKLAQMVQEKSTQLHQRYINESQKLTQISKDSLAGSTTRQLKILNAKG